MTDQQPGVGFEMTLERSFAAPRELVFDCLTQAKHLARWWGPRGYDAPVAESDVRPGGAILLHMRAVGSDEVNPIHGEFLKVSPPDSLSYVLRGFQAADGSWGIEHVSTFAFEEAPGGATLMKMKTVVTQVSDELRFALGGMREGWSQSLDKMAELMATLV